MIEWYMLFELGAGCSSPLAFLRSTYHQLLFMHAGGLVLHDLYCCWANPSAICSLAEEPA